MIHTNCIIIEDFRFLGSDVEPAKNVAPAAFIN